MMRIFFIFILLSLQSGMSPADALSEVVVHDMVVLAGREVLLRAETKEGFFSKGGEIAEFFVDGASIGKNLSGGDGIAFKRFIPAKPGQYKIRVASGGNQDEGMLLAVKRSAQIVFIDVEGSLLEKYMAVKARSGSKTAIRKISRRYPVIFLRTSLIGEKALKAWLKENGFPPAPVLPWNRGEVFREARGKSLIIKAVVGKPDVVQSAKEYKPLAFSFDSPGDAEGVEDWDEVVKKLK